MYVDVVCLADAAQAGPVAAAHRTLPAQSLMADAYTTESGIDGEAGWPPVGSYQRGGPP